MTSSGAQPRADACVVLGDPISHSLSPVIHRAAYAELGLPWTYEAVRLGLAQFDQYVAQNRDHLVGASVTQPLKRAAFEAADELSGTAAALGVANTLLFANGAVYGANTDVHGIVAAVRDHRLGTPSRAAIIGGGATALSAAYACAQLGVEDLTMHVRDRARSAPTLDRLALLGIAAQVESIGERISAPLVISTLPARAADNIGAVACDPTSLLLDVAYDPWPSSLATRWQLSGGIVVSGLEMLVHQAIGQVRIFVGGADAPILPREPEVLTAMRRAVGLA